jgi:addiction module HigA family antidote
MPQEYNLPNPHPGETLLEDFMKPLGLTAYRVATDIKVPINRIDAIIAGRRSITPDTALRLGAYFKTGPELWLNLQSHYDLMEVRRKGIPDITPCKKLDEKAA